MQGINVFTNATARDAAITAPAEGQFAFTKDNNSLWYYDGAAWVASGATGDIEGVTAGVGISGGGTSGTVTVTNSMATAIDAKGDLVPGTGADTFARLAVGANGTVLTADSAEATGLKWATPATGSSSWVKIVQTSFSAVASQTFDNCYSATYKHYVINIDGMYGSTSTADLQYQARTSAPATISTNYYGGNLVLQYNSATPTNLNFSNASAITLSQDIGDATQQAGGTLFVTLTGNAGTAVSGFYVNGNSGSMFSPNCATYGTGGQAGFILSVSAGTMTGRVTVYGVTE
jgi:hypothetical protein